MVQKDFYADFFQFPYLRYDFTSDNFYQKNEWSYGGGNVDERGLSTLGISNYWAEGPVPPKVREMLWAPLTLVITFST